MEVLEAIHQRRSIRAYTPEPITARQVRLLLNAAIQAPSAMNHQPWAFVIVQDPAQLKRISEEAKAFHRAHEHPHAHLLDSLREFHDPLANPDYNLFYDASTLVLICATTAENHAPGDCCLAAQNFMLAAHALGLGTCPIGLALPWFRQPSAKQGFGIPENYLPVLPIIVGHPRERPMEPERQPPEVLLWVKGPP